ncbi:hypothetical protein CC1G_14529 [Coprinopsis cinerea okayama7|uniref:Uncharacterized protein n=1 Tax=Coprinopsis cinerea (strain Okayama-7 / 130 / ATCC MYA-4618 / FGSC 9003) TaxID=240176 RepID=D6RMX7_COPC7|nr:hypothetical protein CC1G_14529 [Coprinopsis cinerea okayama7\|eukprot:XP_002911097.1 hypothetical protein CC1G_14529 [Coprinopsis cinerea okayama7\
MKKIPPKLIAEAKAGKLPAVHPPKNISDGAETALVSLTDILPLFRTCINFIAENQDKNGILRLSEHLDGILAWLRLFTAYSASYFSGDELAWRMELACSFPTVLMKTDEQLADLILRSPTMIEVFLEAWYAKNNDGEPLCIIVSPVCVVAQLLNEITAHQDGFEQLTSLLSSKRYLPAFCTTFASRITTVSSLFDPANCDSEAISGYIGTLSSAATRLARVPEVHRRLRQVGILKRLVRAIKVFNARLRPQETFLLATYTIRLSYQPGITR